MPYTMTKVTPDGKITETFFPNPIPLIALQTAVGGLIQVLPDFTSWKGRRCTAYVNEEGLLLDLKYNPTATKMWRQDVMLFGNMIICQKNSGATPPKA